MAVIVGKKDEVTPPSLSREYAAALKRHGIAAELSILGEIDHVGVIAAGEVIEAALRLGRDD